MSQQFREIFGPYKEMSVRYDRNQEALWCYFRALERPCFSLTMLKESKQIQRAVIRYFESGKRDDEFPINYMILASQTPGVFNLGGDLSLFIRLIETCNREQLLEYARYCIDICHTNMVNLNLPLTTISYVEGSALGGGFESAMSSNYLIAEKHSQMGLPEIRFNLFPGMGAYSFLGRKVGMVEAEKMITTGKIYSGSELYQMGIIDILAESGQGYEAVDCFIRKHRRASNGLQSVFKVRQLYNPVSYKELMDIAKVWVETALQLKQKDLKTMARFVLAQKRGQMAVEHKPKKVHLVRTKQDRRIYLADPTFPLIDSQGNKIISDRRRNYDRRSIDIMQIGN
jgi:DSF synthase